MRHRAAIFGGIIISVLSFAPGNQLPDAPFTSLDFFVHLGMYFGWLFAILLEDQKQYQVPITRFRIVGKLILVVAFGGIVEVVQEQWIPGRFGDWTDFLANGAGALGAVAASGFIRRG